MTVNNKSPRLERFDKEDNCGGEKGGVSLLDHELPEQCEIELLTYVERIKMLA